MQKKGRLALRWVTGLIIVLLIVLISYFLFGKGDQHDSMKLPSVPVKLVKAKVMNLPVTATAMGQLVTQDNIMLTAQQAGLVTHIDVKNGQAVKKGQLLLTLQHQEQQAAQQKAKAAYHSAKLQFERYRTLLKEGAIAKETFDQQRSAYEQAKAALAGAVENAAETKLRAPFSGKVGIVNVAPGSNVAVGDALLPITHLAKLNVQYELPEKDYAQAKIGQTVQLKAGAYPGQTFKGKVIYIAPTVHQATRAFNVRASVDNVDEKLVPGMLATVTQIFKANHSGLVIPAIALVPAIDGMTVYRVKKDKIYSIPVVVSHQVGYLAVIKKGLKAGEQIVASGSAKVNLGSHVKVVS